MTPQQANLAPCPFCNAAARIESNRDWHKLKADHDEDCIFIDEEILVVPAQDGPLAAMIADWNRRAPAPTEPAVDRDAVLRTHLENVLANPMPMPMMPDDVFHAASVAHSEAISKAKAYLATPASQAVPEPAPLAPTLPDGWVLAPKEPTQSMCEQGFYEFDPDGMPDAANMWRAMVRAVPESPQVAQASQPTSAEGKDSDRLEGGAK